MKSHYPLITFLFFGIISFIVFDAVHNSADSHTSGAPASRTGSPGDGGNTCKNCHAGPTPTTQPGLITSNIPVAGYTAGQTYTITATITANGHTKFGFEISPQSPTGTQLGTLIVTNSTEMQLVGSGKYITHKTAGVSGTNSRTWIFNWTAPAAGTGNVTFYGAFNITNAGNNSSGDTTVLSSLLVSECTVPSQPANIFGPGVFCPNATNLTYFISPVSGATSYSWTVPAGWTILGVPTDTMNVLSSSTGGIITVTAANSCGTSQVTSILVSADQLFAVSTATDIICNGASNGTASASQSNGVAPFHYMWSNGQTTSTITNLNAGIYTVTITDDVGCTSSSSVPVTEPSALQLSSSATDASCGAADGSSEVVAGGGVPGYLYSWNSTPIQTTSIASNLLPGIYTVTVTDQLGCTATSTVTVGVLPGPVATAQNISNVNCNGGSDGEALAIVTGGTAPYSYQWSPSGGNNATAQNLSAGNYSVLVTDVHGCSSAANVVITESPLITLSTSSTDANCGQSNGTASVIAGGGTGGFTYAWSTIPVQSNPTATNLPAASYQVIVTDANGCSMSATVGVSNITGPVLQIGPTVNVTCFGGDDGSIIVIPNGGLPPYTYQWAPSGGNDSVATNLMAGTYSVTVTDQGGCISVLTETVNEPDELLAQPGPDASICIGESVTLGVSPVASGGTPNYAYLWSPAASLNSPTDSMPVATPFTNTDYMLVVIDAHGCSDSSIVSVFVNAIPSTPTITSNTDSLISTNASTYQWYLNGNIINGATSQVYVPQQSGNYSVVVTDGNACTAMSADYFFNFNSIGQPADENLFEVYPNPASQSLFIRLSHVEEIEMHIVGLRGERFITNVPNSSADFYKLDISDLMNGIYILEINVLSENKISRKVFIKE
jgi:hypothetical protein